MSRRVTVALISAALCVLAPGAQAYLKIGVEVDGRVVGLRWPGSIPYFIGDAEVAGVSTSALRTTVERAFSTWGTSGSRAVSSSFLGVALGDAGAEDGASVIGFAPIDDEGVLGQTSFVVDETTGQILESDIQLNANFPWSVAPEGEAGRYDVESIVVHEIGHLLGLGHSALGETELLEGDRRRVLGKAAVMFPIAFPAGNIADRQLKPDDIAGVSDLYPTAGFNRATGSIVGHVRMSGRGLFGAHVTGYNLRTGAAYATFSLSADGGFVLAGLEPGVYIVRTEPLDDASVDSFFDTETAVDADFRARFGALAVVPPGGRGPTVDIEVAPK
jgi:hypothetical protein